MFSLRFLAPAAFAILALSSSLSHAATFNLTINGQSPQELIDAINTANSNGEADTINLSGYVNFEQADNTTYGPTGFPVIKNDGELTINGLGYGTFIGRINNTNNPKVRIFAVGPDAKLTINNLRFSNGSAGTGLGGSPESPTNRGGALYNGNGGTLALNGCDFDYNSAVTGGAIFNGQGSTVKINGGQIRYNSSDYDGGAIFNEAGAITLENVEFSDNNAIGVVPDQGGRGGAISLRNFSRVTGEQLGNGTLKINRCLFGDGNAGNTARLGGAISNESGDTVSIENSSFRYNSALFGGAIDNVGTVKIANSTLANNRAERQGGAIFTQNGPVEIRNSTLGQNSAADAGSAIANSSPDLLLESCTLSNNSSAAALTSSAIEGHTTRVHNTIIAGNTTDVESQTFGTLPYTPTYRSAGYNLIGNGNAASDFDAIGDQTGVTNPGLGSLRDNTGATATYPLQPGSPAIDKGMSALTTDQVGNRRPNDLSSIPNAPSGNGSDIGAVEFDSAQTVSDTVGLLVNTVNDIDDGVCGVQHCSLREAINAVNSNQRSPSIKFDDAIFGASRQTITLGGTQLPAINTGGDLLIEAPAVGLNVDGAGKSKVFTVSGRAILRGLTIRNGNAAQDFDRVGGGIYVTGTATVMNCTFTGNSSPFDGGAVAVNETGNLNLIQCTLAGNSASEGSAVSNFRGRVTIDSCTLVSDNTITSTDNISSSSTRTTVSNSLIVGRNAAGNNGANGSSSYQSRGYNLVTGGVAINAFKGPGDRTDVAVANAGLGALAENGGGTPTIQLLPGSPAINSGNPAITNQTAAGGQFDQRGNGFERVFAKRIDIGAFESQAFLPSVSVSLAPNNPKTNDILTATAVGNSPTDSALTYQYQWMRNGTIIPNETESTLQLSKAGNGDKGDVISVIVRASDSEGTSAPASAQVTVVNSAPVAISSKGSVPADTEKAFVLNAFDADGDALTFQRVGGPRNGVTADIRVDPADGKLKLFYKSRPFYGGVDVIRFVARDSEGKLSNESTLGINVQYTPPPPVNRAPIAGDTFVDTFVGESVVKGLLGSDADGDAISFRIVNNAKYGKSEIRRDADGQWKLFYISLNRFYGNDRVTYIAVDSRGKESNLATVGISFVNRAPSAQNNDLTVASGQPVSQYLFGNDADGDALTFQLVNNPRYGTGSIARDEQGNWRVYYQSVPGYAGPDRITFIAIDPQGKQSSVATANINVVRVVSTPSAIQTANAPSGGAS